MGLATERGDLSRGTHPAPAVVRRRLPHVQEQGHRARAAGWRSGDDAHGLPGGASVRRWRAAYSVVWWSPETGVLNLDAEAPLGLRRDDLIVKDVAPDIRARYERDYISWRNARKEAISSAEQPSIEVMTATAAAQSSFMARLDEIDVAFEQVAGHSERPGGLRFGTLVHALLADVPLAPGDDLLDRLAAAHGRVLGAEPEEIAAA